MDRAMPNGVDGVERDASSLASPRALAARVKTAIGDACSCAPPPDASVSPHSKARIGEVREGDGCQGGVRGECKEGICTRSPAGLEAAGEEAGDMRRVPVHTPPACGAADLGQNLALPTMMRKSGVEPSAADAAIQPSNTRTGTPSVMRLSLRSQLRRR